MKMMPPRQQASLSSREKKEGLTALILLCIQVATVGAPSTCTTDFTLYIRAPKCVEYIM
eukprot:SAG25_NODE_2031_length_2012_cov_1.507580_4_plen_59_part_00